MGYFYMFQLVSLLQNITDTVQYSSYVTDKYQQTKYSSYCTDKYQSQIALIITDTVPLSSHITVHHSQHRLIQLSLSQILITDTVQSASHITDVYHKTSAKYIYVTDSNINIHVDLVVNTSKTVNVLSCNKYMSQTQLNIALSH